MRSQRADPGRGEVSRGLLCGLLVLLGLCACQPNKVASPNIVLIVVDTLRTDHLGCYDYPIDTSPNIDALAGTGTRYLNAFSQAPWTTPSVASLMTSLYPSELGIHTEPQKLLDEFLLLPEVLKEQGYQTGAAISHSYINRHWNFDQGFESFFDTTKGEGAIAGEAVSDTAIAYLQEVSGREKPFFLFLHYFDPHFFYIEHPSHVFSQGIERGRVASGQNTATLADIMRSPTKGEREYLLALYDSEIAYTDEQIGRVLDKLKELRLFNDSIIVLTADHGEEFLDHGRLYHTKTLYNELIHVPLIIKWPRGREERVVSNDVALIDIYPSILDYLEIAITPGISGERLGTARRQRLVFSETSRQAKLRCIVEDGAKLIWNVQADRFALYDLIADPEEKNDLSGPQSTRFEQLRTGLARIAERIAQVDVTPESVAISEEERRRLDALGYVSE